MRIPLIPVRRPRVANRRLRAAALGVAWCVLSQAASAQMTPAQTATAPPSDSVGRRRIQPLPALASAPETGLQYGATVLAVWEPARILATRPSSVTASALRTAKQQTRLRVDAEHWSKGNARRLGGSLQWQQFPLPYFGVGDRSPSSPEETFTPTGLEATVMLQQRVARAWYATGSIRHLSQRIATDTSGALRTANVVGRDGGTLTEWSAGLQTDSRDHLFAPRSGRWVQLSYGRSVRGLWSDYAFGTLRLDARRFDAIATEHVVATQVQVVAVDGNAPFDQLALVGNSDILRGYARGRFRDGATAAIQSEYRSPIRRRVGAVVFGGLGAAARRLASLDADRLLPSYGAGLRVVLDQRLRTGIRADYGRGRGGASGLYIGFNQAF